LSTPSADLSEPSEPVTLYFPLRGGGYGRVRLAWIPGKQLVDYLHHPALNEHHLILARKRCRVRDQRARTIRMGSPLHAGDVIVMERAAAT